MLSLGLVGLLSGVAFGQSAAEDYTFNLELFRPHPDFYGYAHTQSAATLMNLQLGVGAWLNYANDPLVLVGADGNRIPVGASATGDKGDAVIDSRLSSELQVGMGFTRFASLTVGIPAVLSQSGYLLDQLSDPTIDNALPAPQGGLGDLTVQPKFIALDRDKIPVGLALAVPVTVPTGSATGYIGEKNVTANPILIFEYSNAPIHSREYAFRTALNVGYLVRTDSARIRDVNVGNAVTYAVAVGIHPTEPVEFSLEYHGQSFGQRASQTSSEALVGVKGFIGRWVALTAGGGLGTAAGIGTPDFRVYGGVQVAPSFDPNARDTDGDAVNDGVDKCPKDPEDVDGYQDTDGCPELDNDADGREDGVDKCPDDPEDDDGYLDNDGCPDNDNDKDNVADGADRCPDEAESMNGYLDEDGCPDEKPVDDTDGDGYKDDIDRCPYDAEDLDNFEDEDGCPDKDNDGDSIPDAQDKCPDAREVFNGTSDEDGCPDESERVVVESGSIKINDVIYFDTGKNSIQERSYSLMDEIAAVVIAHPEILKLRVEGHTDAQGNDTANLKLSQARAESVVAYLVSKGVEKSRLDAAGFGEMRPIADNGTNEGRAQNRRVEFIITDRK